MTELGFRNVDASPDEAVERWPQEAIQTALERGGLQHWRRLAAAIKTQPWGPVARNVEEVLSYSRPYGVAKVMERVINRARSEAEAAEREAVAADIRQLIDSSGLSRRDFASRIGTSTSRLSTYATGKVVPSATLLLRMRYVLDAESTKWSSPAASSTAGPSAPEPEPKATSSRGTRRGWSEAPKPIYLISTIAGRSKQP